MNCLFRTQCGIKPSVYLSSFQCCYGGIGFKVAPHAHLVLATSSSRKKDIGTAERIGATHRLEISMSIRHTVALVLVSLPVRDSRL